MRVGEQRLIVAQADVDETQRRIPQPQLTERLPAGGVSGAERVAERNPPQRRRRFVFARWRILAKKEIRLRTSDQPTAGS